MAVLVSAHQLLTHLHYMGAAKPTFDKIYQPPRHGAPFPFIPFALLALFALLVSMPRKAAMPDPEVPVMSPLDQEKLSKRLREIDDSEQYALIAEGDGWYPCLHSGRTQFYLHAGEVWKYGVTSKGQTGRYSISFLTKHNVSYLIQFKGNFAECLKQEQIKLFNYLYLPENTARSPENRLLRPPYNSIMR